MSAANQKTITITNKPPCDKNHPYTVTNLSAKYFAMRKLQSLAGYKLWEYLAANQENYTIELSQVAIEKNLRHQESCLQLCGTRTNRQKISCPF